MDEKQRILIVDDDESTRKSLTLIFERMGYETEAVGTGHEGLGKARDRFVNVAILDIRLPDIEGVDLIAPLKEMHPDMAVIVVTAYASVQTSMRALNEGASAYMSKPLDLNHVLATVAEALDKQRVVDEKRRAEQALRESEEKYRDLVENINDVIYTIDGNGVLMYINPAVELCLGYSPSELEGQSFAPFLHEEDAQRAMDGFVSLLSGRPTTGEYRLLAKSGEFRWMRTSNRPVLEGDRVIGATGVLTDITERKQMEEALRASAEKLRTVIESMDDGVAVTDSFGYIREANDALVNLHGFNCKEDIIGTHAMEVIANEDKARVGENIGKIVGEENVPRQEYLLRRENSAPFPAEINASLLRDAAGNPAGVVAAIRDITERKQAEQALRASEEKYRTLAENTNDLFYFLSSDGTITYIGPQIERYGFSQEEAISRNFLEFIVPEDRERVVQEIQRAVSTGEERPIEFRVAGADGTVYWLEDHGRTQRDESGTWIGIAGVSRDVTERKQAEAALSASEEKLRAIFETMTDAIAVVDVSGNIIEVNEAAVRLHGYSRREELVGRNALDLIAEKDRARAIEVLGNVVAGGSTPLMQYSLLTNDNTTVDVEVGAAVLRDGHGNPVGVVAVMRAITERKRMEAALQRSEAKFKQIFNNVREEIVLVDTSGNVVEVNERSQDLLGYPPEEIVGRNFAELDFVIDPEVLSRLATLFMQAMAGERQHESYVEFEGKHADGHIIPAEVSIGPLEGANGEIEGFLAVLRDVSERKRAEEELARVRREKDAQLIQSAKLANLGEMATGIAHEINQPLNIIKLTCSGLDRSMRRGKTITPEILSEELQSIDSQIERMRAIINHMRTFARRSSEVKSEYTDMNIPLQECFKFVGEQLRLREIEVQLELEELPTVMADSNKIEQVFLNIIGNARDAMDNFAASAGPDYKKLLKVRSFAENGNAVVIFTDTGGGIPQNIRDRIFEPFFTTKEVGKGTGLGLSISYSIVKEVDGTLDFSVEDGVGTTFRVTVPIASARRKLKGDSSPLSS